MEPKKNPKYDVHNKRNVIFNFSLALSLLIVICAFKIVAPEKKIDLPGKNSEDLELLYVPPITKIKTEKPDEPAKPKPIQQTIAAITFKPVAELTETLKKTPYVDVDKPADPAPLRIDPIPVEKTDSVFRIVEKMPEPVGGYEGFFNTLRKNVKYPTYARRIGTEGNVFVEFTVSERGNLENLHVVTGIGSGCDEEAMRVLKLTKWEPGKQRGKPVKVRMMQRVKFTLEK